MALNSTGCLSRSCSPGTAQLDRRGRRLLASSSAERGHARICPTGVSRGLDEIVHAKCRACSRLWLSSTNGADKEVTGTLWNPTNPVPGLPGPADAGPGRGRAALGADEAAGPPHPSLSSLLQADVRDEDALVRAFEGVDCVFHMASHGMSGAEKVGGGGWGTPPSPSTLSLSE